MTTIKLGWGSLEVKDPPDFLADKLRIFRRAVDGRGRYQELSWMSDGTLVTLPGFAKRVLSMCDGRVFDKRRPLPEPDMDAALDGLRDYQVPVVKDLIAARGGVASLPMAFGKTHVIAAVIKAFPHEEMVVRDTPLVVVVEPSVELVTQTYDKLGAIIPGRTVGKLTGRSTVETDDILVTTYESLKNVDLDSIGILIADEVHCSASKVRADLISRVRNAARWGMSATPTGRFDGADLLVEGMFGPIAARRTYDDMVKDGILAPIEVIWLPAPKPAFISEGSYPDLVASVTRKNAAFVEMVAKLLERIPDDMKTICFTEHVKLMAEIAKIAPDIPYVHGESSNVLKLTKADRDQRRKQLESGEIKKILSSYVWKEGVDIPDLSVVISTSCGGSEIAASQIPGRLARLTEGKAKGWLIDFGHRWDMARNGHPGRLLLNDRARMNRYRELQFDQTFVNSIDEVPFIRG